ncbi:hypothetical protein MLD38_008792 [Melastoma candidum]|uniref:Uncharacterized protein n=1 Tax=Melastoma candidum TaxID=119954 RepID=A0ACB9RUX6_9MYRT|nr:hypothetical protein MLD38_008792 [Melastoma candidum]
MRLLTGCPDDQQKTKRPSFAFVPADNISSFGPLVIAEGCDVDRSVFWVHVWTVSDDGVITRVREYFNTSLTVTRLGVPEASPSEIAPNNDSDSVWESSLWEHAGKSVPGLVLAL